MTVKASANLDDIRREFYDGYLSKENPETRAWWIRQVLIDPNELVVEDDESGKLYKLPFTSDDGGKIVFGDSEPVRIDYVPEEREFQKAAASHASALFAIGRKVAASYSTRAESSPDNSGGAMDPKEVRKVLNLPEDASDEQVQTALLLKAGLTGAETPEQIAAREEKERSAAEAASKILAEEEVKRQAEEAAAKAAATAKALADQGITLPPGTVLVDEETWKQTQEGLAKVDTLVSKAEQGEVQDLIAAAIGDGRIPPSRKDHWAEYLKADPEGGKVTLASLKPNIIPLTERGHAHSPESHDAAELDAEQVGAWSEELFPEVRSQNARERAAAGTGLHNRPRVMSDAHYSRR